MWFSTYCCVSFTRRHDPGSQERRRNRILKTVVSCMYKAITSFSGSETTYCIYQKNSNKSHGGVHIMLHMLYQGISEKFCSRWYAEYEYLQNCQLPAQCCNQHYKGISTGTSVAVTHPADLVLSNSSQEQKKKIHLILPPVMFFSQSLFWNIQHKSVSLVLIFFLSFYFSSFFFFFISGKEPLFKQLETFPSRMWRE